MNHIAPGAKRYSSTCPRSSIGAPNQNWNYFGDFRPGANTRAAEMRQLPLKGMYGADVYQGRFYFVRSDTLPTQTAL
jgi:hypothetical protein